MSSRLGHHRPLMGGIAIMPREGEQHKGTLTGIARRADDTKVLVTCLHVVSTDNWNVNGDEFIYQGGTDEQHKVGQLYTRRNDDGEIVEKGWLEVISGEENSNTLDIAILSPVNVSDSDLKFQLHSEHVPPRTPPIGHCQLLRVP